MTVFIYKLLQRCVSRTQRVVLGERLLRQLRPKLRVARVRALPREGAVPQIVVFDPQAVVRPAQIPLLSQQFLRLSRACLGKAIVLV